MSRAIGCKEATAQGSHNCTSNASTTTDVRERATTSRSASFLVCIPSIPPCHRVRDGFAKQKKRPKMGEALSAGPDVVLVVRRDGGDGEEETQELTVTWDQSFMDVLACVQKLFEQRLTLQFTHRVPLGGSAKGDGKFSETTVKVEDDELFDVLIEFALEQPERRLEVLAVETHWWPKDGVDHFLERDDFSKVACAPVVRCCNRQASGTIPCKSKVFLL